MNEYRRAKRRKAGNIDVIDTMTGQPIGRLSNLSETGMLLILHHPLVSDALFRLGGFPQNLMTLSQGDRTSLIGKPALGYMWPLRRIRDRARLREFAEEGLP